MLALLTEIAESGIEHDAGKYVTVQIHRQAWADLQALKNAAPQSREEASSGSAVVGQTPAVAAPVSVPSASALPRTCQWSKDGDAIYATGCGHHFCYSDGTRTECSAKFCQGCGGVIEGDE